MNKNSNKWHYRAIPEVGYNEDIGYFDTYGIKLTGDEYEEVLHDVSNNEETVLCMTELFNHHQLSPHHFLHTIEDFLP